MPLRASARLEDLDAVIFDLDGVVTDTASVHAEAWKQVFDDVLRREQGPGIRPFSDEDYREYVDGKPRYDGARDFLASRALDLPFGSPADPPSARTVCGIANRKDALFGELLERRGGAAFPTTIELIEHLRARGVRTAIISASKNCARVLEAAGISRLFDAKVDGVDAERLGLPGKPDPAVFLAAADRLGVSPARAAVVEDALAGVEAGRAGAFALVVGVDRTGHAAALRARGADVVVADLGELVGDA